MVCTGFTIRIVEDDQWLNCRHKLPLADKRMYEKILKNELTFLEDKSVIYCGKV